mmetsp:Transcript_18572/g.21371  ORF Transcript_18572/g.21371 Transcript_18572/m.21371 type:complete len:84 (+) Transcript_18572:174-425(+)
MSQNACLKFETRMNETKFEISDLRQTLATSSNNPTRSDQSLENDSFDPRLSRVNAGTIKTSKDEFLREIDQDLPKQLQHFELY